MRILGAGSVRFREQNCSMWKAKPVVIIVWMTRGSSTISLKSSSTYWCVGCWKADMRLEWHKTKYRQQQQNPCPWHSFPLLHFAWILTCRNMGHMSPLKNICSVWLDEEHFRGQAIFQRLTNREEEQIPSQKSYITLKVEVWTVQVQICFNWKKQKNLNTLKDKTAIYLYLYFCYCQQNPKTDNMSQPQTTILFLLKTIKL